MAAAKTMENETGQRGGARTGELVANGPDRFGDAGWCSGKSAGDDGGRPGGPDFFGGIDALAGCVVGRPELPGFGAGRERDTGVRGDRALRATRGYVGGDGVFAAECQCETGAERGDERERWDFPE